MTPPTYLTKRGRTWYVQIPVPRARQQAVGSKTLERSLRTQDESEAHRLRHRVIAEFQALIAEAPPSPAEVTPEVLLQRAQQVRAEVDAGTVDPQNAELAHDAAVDDYLKRQARVVGVDSEGNPRIPESNAATIRRATRVLTGNPALTLGYQSERYLTQVRGSAIMRQTVGDKERHLGAFLDWIGRDTDAKRVTKSRATAYLDEVLMPRKVSLQTKRTALNTVQQFFDWMEARDVVALNPFDKIGKLLKESKRGKKQARRPWAPEELLKVLEYIPQDDPMWPLMALGAYTGARREDLCALRVEHASESVLEVQEGKTAAARRRVPVHPVIRPLVRRLLDISNDGFLLPGLLTSGVDNKRGVLIGKRLAYAIRRAGVKDSQVVLHASRNSILSQMEAAGVSLSLRAQIVGHARKTITEEVYTAKADDARRAAALAHVTYGREVDNLVRKVGKSLTINKVAQRRSKGPASDEAMHGMQSV